MTHSSSGRAEGSFTTFDSIVSNLANTGRGLKQALSIAMDSTLVVISLWAAYTLRHGELFSDFRSTWYLFVLLPLITVVGFTGLGVYRWVIRSTNQRLFRQLIKGSAFSGLALLVAFFMIPPDRANPRSLFVVYMLLLLFGTVGVRLLWRQLFDSGSKGQPIAIYGAGDAGRQLVSLLGAGSEFRPVAFIDDDRALVGSTLSGIPIILGSAASLKNELKRFDVNRVVLAMPSLSSSVYQAKLKQLDTLNFPVLTMPSVGELIAGTARADEIRDVSINDILGRGEVLPDIDLMSKRVAGKSVLVTGGGGSIGSELCRQIMLLGPRRLIILDSCEANLYHITEEFLSQAKNAVAGSPPVLPLLGSVNDKMRMNRIFQANKIETVFHAAAYKHVPIVEAQPDQGVEVNVFGTLTILDIAISHAASDFLLISTDKAVRPTNVMGASKRVAELILQAKARTQSETRISIVRFGNVLGSSGSVVPKFKKQIQEGGPITLTHMDITRYFMTIPEAAQLVLQASAIAKSGDVFVLDMGEPVRIEQLATTMVRLYGKKLKRDTGRKEDIEVIVEGLRPGEKMFEELFLSNEFARTEAPKIFSADEFWLDWRQLSVELAQLREVLNGQDVIQITSLVSRLAYLTKISSNPSEVV